MLLLKLLLPQLLLMLDGTLCHTACSAVSTAQNTTVTCLFGEDISQQGFSVLSFKTAHSDGALVLACNRRQSGGLICDKGKGVDFDEDQRVKHQLTLTRTSSDSIQGMEYLCQMVPGGGERVDRCNVIKSNIPSPTTPASNLHPIDKEGSNTPVNLILVISIFLFIITMSALVLCGILFLRRKQVTWRCTQFFRHVWSDSDQVPGETVSKKLEGQAAYYFNLGWREALRNEQDPNEDDNNIGSSTEQSSRQHQKHNKTGVKPNTKDPHKEKSYAVHKEARDPEGAAAAQPLLRESRVQGGRAEAALSRTSKDQGKIFHDAREQIELKSLEASDPMVKGEQQSSSVAEQQITRPETKKEKGKREEAEKQKAKAEKKANKAAEKEKIAKEAAEKAEKMAKEAAETEDKGVIKAAKTAENKAKGAAKKEKEAKKAAEKAEKEAKEAAA